MSRLSRFEHVTESSTSEKGLNLNETVKFHYFNPNGLCSEWIQLCELLMVEIEKGRFKSGYALAYGRFNDFYYKQFSEKCLKKRVSRIDVKLMCDGITRDIEKLKEILSE